MNDLLPDIRTHLDLWLSVLADNELSAAQRNEFVEFLDSNQDHWRACAVTLMDQQIISGGFRDFERSLMNGERSGGTLQIPDQRRSSVRLNGNSQAGVDGPLGTPLPVVLAPSKPVSGSHFRRRGVLALIGVAASVAAFALGMAWANQATARDQELLMSELQNSRSTVCSLSKFITASQESNATNSLGNLYSENPMLIEIEDNPEKALFLTDRPISKAFLESLVAAGHDVQIKPYEPEFMTRQMSALKNTVFAVEVTKHQPMLLVQGDN